MNEDGTLKEVTFRGKKLKGMEYMDADVYKRQVVDRLKIKDGIQKRLADSAETASALSGGVITVDVIGDKSITFSENFACPECGISIPEIEPRSFSFNNPSGA